MCSTLRCGLQVGVGNFGEGLLRVKLRCVGWATLHGGCSMWEMLRRPNGPVNVIRIWTSTFRAVVVFVSPNSAHQDRERRSIWATFGR